MVSGSVVSCASNSDYDRFYNTCGRLDCSVETAVIMTCSARVVLPRDLSRYPLSSWMHPPLPVDEHPAGVPVAGGGERRGRGGGGAPLPPLRITIPMENDGRSPAPSPTGV
ncbi:unnamed protein product [Plutella xylostella]|uniref:(diamondback moth) hypothetical protein n=1 Tax=Plutella xylostella TaxID=51655 RepID=A0A8S4D2Y7_PLUXY|nr:unnamed protein product [Plutella xylostella]